MVSPDDYHPGRSNVIQPDGTIHIYPVDANDVERKWLFERGTVEEIKNELRLKYSSSKNKYEVIRVKDEINYKTVWTDNKYNAKTFGTILIKDMMGSVFSNPKSLYAVEECIKAVVHDKDEAIIMDFFSGSSTTAHAVMNLNSIDGGKRRFIMIQLPENLDENLKIVTPAEKKTIENAIKLCDELSKPHNITEVAKERIRRAGTKIKAENPLTTINLDTGFRVLKLDSSNMKDVYYNPSAYTPDLFDELTNNIKQDRTPEDLLFQVMLELGLELSSKIVETIVAGKKVFNVAEGFLLACFDESITYQVISEIAKQKPYYFVMRDSSLADDTVAANFDQVFDTYSSKTIRKVL